MVRYASLFVVLASAVSAQEFLPRAGDTVLDTTAMGREVVGRNHEFFDGGVSSFGLDGAYSYTYPGGGTAFGTYDLRGQGVICSDFNHGFSRCDLYVHDGTRLVLITEDGTRYPVRVVN